MMRFSVFQVSRRGGRSINEDRMGYCYTRESAVFVLADGLGGHPEGEVAAQLALQGVVSLFQKMALPKLTDITGFLTDAVLVAHRKILHYAATKAMLDTPRTTLVLAVVQSGSVTWAHCGDSRLYMVRRGELLTRTRDHSFLEQPQAGGPECNNRNVLFTCLGSPAKPVFNITGPMALMQGDKVLLCSDGLWAPLTEDKIVSNLSHKTVDIAVPDLVEQALRQAGSRSDNVTCLALEWETPDGFEPTCNTITTDTILDGAFESSVLSGQQDASLDDLDEAAIERSIAEINEAIRRTAEKNL